MCLKQLLLLNRNMKHSFREIFLTILSLMKVSTGNTRMSNYSVRPSASLHALAIFVACLGLFGLAMFSTIQRTKEIGVRKVFGASVSNILLLLSKDFVKLVLIAMSLLSRCLVGHE